MTCHKASRAFSSHTHKHKRPQPSTAFCFSLTCLRIYDWLIPKVWDISLDISIHPCVICWYDVAAVVTLPPTHTHAAPTLGQLDKFLSAFPLAVPPYLWLVKIDAYHWTTIFTSVISVDMTCHMADRASHTHTCGTNPWTTRQIFIRFTLALGGRLTTNNNKPQTKKNFPFNQKSDIRGAQ